MGNEAGGQGCTDARDGTDDVGGVGASDQSKPDGSRRASHDPVHIAATCAPINLLCPLHMTQHIACPLVLRAESAVQVGSLTTTAAARLTEHRRTGGSHQSRSSPVLRAWQSRRWTPMSRSSMPPGNTCRQPQRCHNPKTFEGSPLAGRSEPAARRAGWGRGRTHFLCAPQLTAL